MARQVVANYSSRHCWFDQIRGIVWIAIPKCASTSLMEVISTGDPYQLAGREIPKKYFSVMFIRHPWQRLASAMRHLEETTMDGVFENWMNRDPEEFNEHIRPFWCFHAQYRLDFVGRLESLEEDWKRLQEDVGLPCLPRKNKAPKKVRWWELDFDWSLIEEIYKPDFELFNSL